MLERVRAIQLRDGLSDGQIAAKLGVSRSQWNHVKHGRRAFGNDMAVHAAASWPELTRDLLDRVASVADKAA